MQLGRRLGGEHIYNCTACDANPLLRTMLGHDGPPTQYWRENLITGAPLARCPVRTLQLAGSGDEAPLLDELNRYLDVYYPALDAGFLLETGGVGDQPARYWDLIQAIRDTAARQQAKYDDLTAPPSE